MSDHENAGQPPLWGDDSASNYGRNPTEDAVIEAIEELNAATPLVGMQKAIAQVCRSLGRNIDSGNLKGRAVANEATQLAALLNQLAGVEPDDVPTDTIPKATQDLINALATAPRLDTPSPSDPAQL